MSQVLDSRFSVMGEAVPQQRPRASVVGGHARVHDVPKCTQFRSYVRMCTAHAYEGEMDCESCFEVHLIFCLAIPKSVSKRKREQMVKKEILPTRKPDLDNAAKGVLDAMTGIIWKDDSQITRLCLSKEYSEIPRTDIVIYRREKD